VELSFIEKFNVQDLVGVKKQKILLGYLTTVLMHALNRKFSKEGVRKNSNDLIVNYLYEFYNCDLIKYLFK